MCVIVQTLNKSVKITTVAEHANNALLREINESGRDMKMIRFIRY